MNHGPQSASTDLPFRDLLFGQAAAEDSANLSPGDLDGLARGAFEFLRSRPAGETKIRLTPLPGGAGLALESLNQDMPFLLDSTLAELMERGIGIRLVAHPIFSLSRNPDGGLALFNGLAAPDSPKQTARESLLHIHISPLDESAQAALTEALRNVYRDVSTAVRDWQAMRARLAAIIARYRADPPPLPADEIAEAVQLLDWLLADNFTFLGMREHSFQANAVSADPLPGSGLGILSDPDVHVLRRGKELVAFTPEIRRFFTEPVLLILTKANVKSRVHRRAHLDYVGVKLFDAAGGLQGEFRIVGLLTSSSYTQPARVIPYLRHKVARVVSRAGHDPKSHSGKALINVLENFPRDELFQISPELLFEQSNDILLLSDRPRLRVLTRADQFERFVSVIVYVPKDRYDTSIRVRIGEYLCKAFDGRVSAVYPFYPDGPLARTHFIIGRYDGETPQRSRAELESAIAAIIETWGDGLRAAASAAGAAALPQSQVQTYAEIFSPAYRAAYMPAAALRDISILAALSHERRHLVDFYRRGGGAADCLSLKVFSLGRPLPLSERVPLLESMGFSVIDESTFETAKLPESGEQVWIHDMALRRASGAAIDTAGAEQDIEELLIAALKGETEIDRHNALVLEAGLNWRAAAALRALSRYARQICAPFSQEYLAATLVKHAAIARAVFGLFEVRFSLAVDADRAGAQQAALAAIEAQLAKVDSLDEDRILRLYVSLVTAMVRTNYFQRAPAGGPRPTIAFKFESRKIPGLPLPKPLFEVFVCSPRVEAVHLRFGKVARGGIRWSDRPEDFRTEVLGLVKAQQVKNAVIVPVGAKGGFLPKRLPPPGDRQAWLEEGTESYRVFIRALLELTDNIVDGGIRPPPDTIRHDSDDPYLVVAADKGTATFSDTANALSEENGHWLGDAFASGGSAGYDHKKMAITARGAWEAVKRHFREMELDIQKTPFTVAGVGDMSGDVFGNGMLLSPAIRLVAAFDHRDIFIDPDPDLAVSLSERQRIFGLPRSSWQDYSRALISRGGGIYPRAAKSIRLSPEAKAAVGIIDDDVTPQRLINAILQARVDLLWFGGIGTYIRASDETDADAGDRSNDAVRIAARQIGAKVIGEGANLGMTQRARIEAAAHGVKLNTDAIDNSAGVNSSDVEVNIKIALARPVSDGRLTITSRNALLVEMTQEVAGLVLRNNYLQPLALSLAERGAVAGLGYHRRMMQRLEREGQLDRAVEFLPDDAALDARARAGQGLTRPELAVLLAYAKLNLHDLVLASRAPDDPYFDRELERYFPAPVRKQFPDAIAGHRLRREIIATQLANAVINRGGPSVVAQIIDRTGADAAAITRAYAAVRDSMGLLDLNNALDALDGKISGQRQLELYAMVQDILVSRLVWFVRYLPADQPLDALIAHYTSAIGGAETVWETQSGPLVDEMLRAGMAETAARRLASLDKLHDMPEIVRIADGARVAPASAARVFFDLDAVLPMAALAHGARALKLSDHFDRLAQERAVDGIERARGRLTAEVLQSGDADAAAWARRRADEISRIAASLSEITQSGLSVAKLSVASGLLSDLVRI